VHVTKTKQLKLQVYLSMVYQEVSIFNFGLEDLCYATEVRAFFSFATQACPNLVVYLPLHLNLLIHQLLMLLIE